MINRSDEIAAAVAKAQAESPRGFMLKMEMAARHIGDRYDRGERLAGFELPDRLAVAAMRDVAGLLRSEEHTSELQSLMRISYAVFCLKKKKSESIFSRTD